jgi:hypothetical protein
LLIHDGGAASQPSRQAPVDDNGAFRFDKVMPGSYRVRAYVEEPGADLSVKVENRDVDPLELPIGRVLLGRVRTTDGSRIPTPHFGFGLRRSVDDDLLLLLWTRRVDRPAVPSNLAGVRKDGVFQARPILQQGEYMVEVSLPLGYRIASMTYDGLDLMRVPLKGPLIAGAGIIDIVVAPPLAGATPGVKVSGRVRGLPGGLAEGWFVGIEATSTLTGGGGPIPVGPWGEAPVGSDGSFAFSPVPPGIYRVQALSKRVRSKVGQINVGDRDITNVEIRADDPEPSLAVP